MLEALNIYTSKSKIWLQTDSRSSDNRPRIVRPPADHFFKPEVPLLFPLNQIHH